MAKQKKKIMRPAPNPGIERAIELAGSHTKLAEIMEVTQPAVHHWLFVTCPPERAKEIEEKLGVPREDICPEVFG